MDIRRSYLLSSIVLAPFLGLSFTPALAGTLDQRSVHNSSQGTPGALLLHVVEASENDAACSEGISLGTSIVTAADSRVDGSAKYIVYLVGVPEGRKEDPAWGIAGVQLGIQYGAGVQVLDWRACSDLQFADHEWPLSESGNLMTWEPSLSCQRGELTVLGYFSTRAREPSVMSIVPHPQSSLVRLADCEASETVLDPIAMNRVGWVSFGGAPKGSDTDGCNPVQELCNQDLVPTSSVTWGEIKALYDH